MKTTTPPILTLAITAKNEEKHIRACIESCLRVAECLPCEILLIDSYSTDQTVAIAQEYPIRIVRLRQDWFHSCAAGRHIGAIHGRGRYIWYIDGDMIAQPPFAAEAVHFLDEHPDAAGVMGILEDIIPFENESRLPYYGSDQLPGFDPRVVSQLRYIVGGGLFRREALLAVGNYDPYLTAEEDIDIAQRLRARGSDLYYLPTLAIVHHGRSSTYWKEVTRRVRRNLYSGLGTNLLRARKSPLFGEIVNRYSKFLFALCQTLLTLTLILLAIIFHARWPLILALISEGLVMLANIAAKKNVSSGIRAYLTQKIIGFCMIRGFLRGLTHQKSYPQDVEVIKEA